MDLDLEVRRFIREARTSPAQAVGPALDRLEQVAGKSSTGSYVARAEPCANYTWQLRSLLAADAEDSEADEVRLGEPCRIVGWKPTLLLVDATPGKVLPPMEAIDVELLVNRKSEYTATAVPRSSGAKVDQVVNLPLLDVVTRVVNLELGRNGDPRDPILTARFEWAVPVATVAAFNWGDTQISLGFFVRFDREECC